jgi:hypothetical protein
VQERTFAAQGFQRIQRFATPRHAGREAPAQRATHRQVAISTPSAVPERKVFVIRCQDEGGCAWNRRTKCGIRAMASASTASGATR